MTNRREYTDERRVYLLPSSLLDRIRTFQNKNGLKSEGEAVRRLLTKGLQQNETVEDLLESVKDLFKTDKDFRSISKKIVADHMNVRKLKFLENEFVFVLCNGDAGSIDQFGNIKQGKEGADLKIEWHEERALGIMP